MRKYFDEILLSFEFWAEWIQKVQKSVYIVDLVKSFLMSKNRLRHSRERAAQSLEVIQVILSIHCDEAARGGLRVPGRYGVGGARRHRAPARIHDGINQSSFHQIYE